MAIRSYSDVPNRIVHLFLQEAGASYDIARGFKPFKRVAETLDFFDGRCAYCGASREALVEEHVVPRNRVSVGLHAWGNVVPACASCNRAKSSSPWGSYLATIADDPSVIERRQQRITSFRAHFRYDPATDQLRDVVEALYTLADTQSRALVKFALKSSSLALQGMHDFEAPLPEQTGLNGPAIAQEDVGDQRVPGLGYLPQNGRTQT